MLVAHIGYGHLKFLFASTIGWIKQLKSIYILHDLEMLIQNKIAEKQQINTGTAGRLLRGRAVGE